MKSLDDLQAIDCAWVIGNVMIRDEGKESGPAPGCDPAPWRDGPEDQVA